MRDKLTGVKTLDIAGMKALMLDADQEQYAAIDKQVVLRIEKGGYQNYNFYNNINYCLYKLGYPREYQWEEWRNAASDEVNAKGDTSGS